VISQTDKRKDPIVFAVAIEIFSKYLLKCHFNSSPEIEIELSFTTETAPGKKVVVDAWASTIKLSITKYMWFSVASINFVFALGRCNKIAVEFFTFFHDDHRRWEMLQKKFTLNFIHIFIEKTICYGGLVLAYLPNNLFTIFFYQASRNDYGLILKISYSIRKHGLPSSRNHKILSKF
jgi:hypothetical protein